MVSERKLLISCSVTSYKSCLELNDDFINKSFTSFIFVLINDFPRTMRIVSDIGQEPPKLQTSCHFHFFFSFLSFFSLILFHSFSVCCCVMMGLHNPYHIM